ncbi:MAG: hypothetical protein RIA71_07825 [Oceanicaulis sp.]
MRAVIVSALALIGCAAAPAVAQSEPFYGQHLAGVYGVYDGAGERVCSVELTDRFNQIREVFAMTGRDCPEPLASARRWQLERGMDAGRHQIAFWSGGFTPAWRGSVPSPQAQFWTGETSNGTPLTLRPESDAPRAWLRGEPQAQRRALDQASRLRPGDLLGRYQLSPLNGYPRECFLTLFRGPNGGGRVGVEGEGCGPFINADRFRYQQGRVLIADRSGQRVWSGAVQRPDGGIRLAGGDRDVGRWELNRLGATLPPSGRGVDMESLAGRWTFEGAGPPCPLTLTPDGRVSPGPSCDDPGQLFARWRLDGDVITLSDGFSLSPSDLWRGRVVDMTTVEGRGTDVLVGLPPREIGRSRLVR